ncbi:MAG: hypothetical protein ACKO7O_00175 [Bacteroidota bacterium]
MSTIFNRIHAIKEVQNRRILFAALNWGMGHVSRSIPLLGTLQEQGNKIFIACNAQQESIYRHYFPNITYYRLQDYPFLFSSKGFRTTDFLRRIPALRRQLRTEKKRVAELVDHLTVDLILSDHRYGFIHPMVESVFITHQCRLPLPWYGFMIQWVHQKLMHQFTSCWIIDTATQEFAGKLSRNPGMPHKYLGIASRFVPHEENKQWKVLLLNGPSEFHGWLIAYYCNQLHEVDYVIGSHRSLPNEIPQITDWIEADRLLNSAHTVLSFCGYSTLLDMHTLRCKWLTVPTPGQFEQAYLYQQKTLREGGFSKH